MAITTYDRTELIALCERLGHDPSRVMRIVMTPQTVEVIYVHPVVDDRGSDEG